MGDMSGAFAEFAKANDVFSELPFTPPSRFVARDRLRAILAQDRAPRGEWVAQPRSLVRVIKRPYLPVEMQFLSIYRWRWL